MDIFEKTVNVVKEAGENVIDSAKSLGNSIYTVSKEQSEFAGLKVQKSFIERKLQDAYAEIGKKYMDYIANSNGQEAFDVSDLIEKMSPDLEKLNEINLAIKEKEQAEEAEKERKAKKAVQDAFNAEKAKLDRALEMDIITQEEYNDKLIIAQKKIDRADQLRKIDLQLEMEIIDIIEYEEKRRKILE